MLELSGLLRRRSSNSVQGLGFRVQGQGQNGGVVAD